MLSCLTSIKYSQETLECLSVRRGFYGADCMVPTMRNNIDLILSYTIKLLMDTVNSIGATIGVEEERMHVCHVCRQST